jgi:hypothetical protein
MNEKVGRLIRASLIHSHFGVEQSNSSSDQPPVFLSPYHFSVIGGFGADVKGGVLFPGRGIMSGFAVGVLGCRSTESGNRTHEQADSLRWGVCLNALSRCQDLNSGPHEPEPLSEILNRSPHGLVILHSREDTLFGEP